MCCSVEDRNRIKNPAIALDTWIRVAPCDGWRAIQPRLETWIVNGNRSCGAGSEAMPNNMRDARRHGRHGVRVALRVTHANCGQHHIIYDVTGLMCTRHVKGCTNTRSIAGSGIGSREPNLVICRSPWTSSHHGWHVRCTSG